MGTKRGLRVRGALVRAAAWAITFRGPTTRCLLAAMARVRGGLSVNDFVKLVTVQEYSRGGSRALGPHAALLAEAEGLTGHAEAIRARFIRRAARA